MENTITLQTIYDMMVSKFDAIDKRFDKIENNISRLAADNIEDHNKIFEELKYINDIILKIETEHEDKLKTLFDADKTRKQHQKLFQNQLRRLSKQADNNSFRISMLEKASLA